MTLTDAGWSSPGGGPVVLPGDAGGVTFVPAETPLVGLNYYDGRFLRADDLNLERRGQRRYVELSTAAGGSGSVWGFELSGLGTGRLGVAAGLGVTPQGRLLHLPAAVTAAVPELAAGPRTPTAPAAPAGAADAAFAACVGEAAATEATVVPGTGLFLVCLAAASGLCGHTEVFGRLCGDGCVTATDRPYVVDGVTLLLRPLLLDVTPYGLAGVTRPEVHLRSQVASAYFDRERATLGTPVSAAVLAGGQWATGAAPPGADGAVPVGVLGWDGTRITLLDAWTARRERMEPTPRSSWAWRTEQRPWPVFLAQVLQFQAQLAAAPTAAATVPARVLVERGFVTVPSGGYLPVQLPGDDLREQVQDLLGPGVELRLCSVRRDQVPYELERAQHLDRISLLRGLEDPEARERVDVLVPDGRTSTGSAPQTGLLFAVDLRSGGTERATAVDAGKGLLLRGAARAEVGDALDARFAVVGPTATGDRPVTDLLGDLLGGTPDAADRVRGLGPARSGSGPTADAAASAVGERISSARAGGRSRPVTLSGTAGRMLALHVALVVDADPFTIGTDGPDRATFDLRVEAFQPSAQATPVDVHVLGFLRPGPDSVPHEAGEVVLRLDGVPGGGEDQGRAFSAAVVLSRDHAGDGGRSVQLRHEDGTVELEVTWRGDPVRGEVQLRVRPSGGQGTTGEAAAPLPIATLDGVEDADVVRRGNTSHDLAVDALAILAGAHLDDPSYAEDRARLLFPPAAPVTSSVLPTLDWVLFRRRLREECEAAVVEPTAVSVVTAWVLHAGSEGAAADVVPGLQQLPWTKQPWQQASVTFAPESSALLTPPASWAARYERLGGGSRIALAAYVPARGVQAATYGFGRASSLLDALEPGARLAPDAVRDLAAGAPAELLLPGTDGSVFLVTHDEPEPEPVERLEVFAVGLGPDDADLRKAIGAGTALGVGLTDDRVDALGEGDLSSFDTGAATEQAKTALENRKVDERHVLEAVLWLHSDASSPQAVQALASKVIDAWTSVPELASLKVLETRTVDIEQGEAVVAARLFLLLVPPALT